MKEVAEELESALRLAGQLRAMPDSAAASKPDPQRWSKKEILGHLLDSAGNNHQRFVRMQLEPRVELPGYEQDGWVRVQRYQDASWSDLIDFWVA